jgi:hypothetical protein
MPALLAVALTLAVPVAASAYDWRNGDVFVGLSTGQYNVYDNGGTLHETINQSTTGAGNFAVDCAFDRASVLYTTAFAQNTVVRFLAPAPHTILTPDLPTPTNPESVSFARDGTFWVGHQGATNSLQHFNGDGSPAGSFAPTAPAAMLDLSADQRTMFYTDRSATAAPAIHRFDVKTGTSLSDFANLGSGTRTIADFKLLPPGDGSGGAIVADTTTIKRVDGQGRVVKTYDAAGQDTWFGIALDPNGKSFWAQTATPGNVFRFNIASGAADRGPLPSAASAFGICVKGTRTAALDNAPPAINITSPRDGATFHVGQVVSAAFNCADDRFGTGLASCSGPVGTGAPVDTASAGTKTFGVTASDVAGNAASRTNTYTVFPRPRRHRVTLEVVFNGRSQAHGALLLTSLKITRLTRGARVQLRCSGGKRKGCAFKRRKVSKPKRTNLAKFLKRRVLKRGAVLQFRATKRHFVGAVANMTIRGGTARLRFLCLPPGKMKPRRRC